MPFNWLRKRRESRAHEIPDVAGLQIKEDDKGKRSKREGLPQATDLSHLSHPVTMEDLGDVTVFKCKRLYKTEESTSGKKVVAAPGNAQNMEMFRPRKCMVEVDVNGVFVHPEDDHYPEVKYLLNEIIFFHRREQPPVFELYLFDPAHPEAELGTRVPLLFKEVESVEMFNAVVLEYVGEHARLKGINGAIPSSPRKPRLGGVMRPRDEGSEGGEPGGDEAGGEGDDGREGVDAPLTDASPADTRKPERTGHLADIPSMASAGERKCDSAPGAIPPTSRRRGSIATELAPLKLSPRAHVRSGKTRRRFSLADAPLTPLSPIKHEGIAGEPIVEESDDVFMAMSNRSHGPSPKKRRMSVMGTTPSPVEHALVRPVRERRGSLPAMSQAISVDQRPMDEVALSCLVIRVMKAHMFMKLNMMVQEVVVKSAENGKEVSEDDVHKAVHYLQAEGRMSVDDTNFCKFIR